MAKSNLTMEINISTQSTTELVKKINELDNLLEQVKKLIGEILSTVSIETKSTQG